jgi:hypothetical protein
MGLTHTTRDLFQLLRQTRFFLTFGAGWGLPVSLPTICMGRFGEPANPGNLSIAARSVILVSFECGTVATEGLCADNNF